MSIQKSGHYRGSRSRARKTTNRNQVGGADAVEGTVIMAVTAPSSQDSTTEAEKYEGLIETWDSNGGDSTRTYPSEYGITAGMPASVYGPKVVQSSPQSLDHGRVQVQRQTIMTDEALLSMSRGPRSSESNMREVSRKSELYKTELCHNLFPKTGPPRECHYRNKCQFAHSYEELNHVKRHPRFKTNLCKQYTSMGRCNYRSRCVFVHDPARVVGAVPDLTEADEPEICARAEASEMENSSPSFPGPLRSRSSSYSDISLCGSESEANRHVRSHISAPVQALTQTQTQAHVESQSPDEKNHQAYDTDKIIHSFDALGGLYPRLKYPAFFSSSQVDNTSTDEHFVSALTPVPLLDSLGIRDATNNVTESIHHSTMANINAHKSLQGYHPDSVEASMPDLCTELSSLGFDELHIGIPTELEAENDEQDEKDFDNGDEGSDPYQSYFADGYPYSWRMSNGHAINCSTVCGDGADTIAEVPIKFEEFLDSYFSMNSSGLQRGPNDIALSLEAAASSPRHYRPPGKVDDNGYSTRLFIKSPQTAEVIDLNDNPTPPLVEQKLYNMWDSTIEPFFHSIINYIRTDDNGLDVGL